MKNELYSNDLGEILLITLTLTKGDDGHESHIVIEGELLDFDEQVLVIKDRLTFREIKINRELIALTEKVTEETETMFDPEKPPKGSAH